MSTVMYNVSGRKKKCLLFYKQNQNPDLGNFFVKGLGILTWTRTGTDPKIFDPESDRKFTSIFGSKLFLPERTGTEKEPIRIDPDPKRTVPNRPDPIRTDLYPT